MTILSSIKRPINLEAMGASEGVDNIVAINPNILEKGILSESFANSGQFNSRVSGKQIKQGLNTYLTHVTKREKELRDQMQACEDKLEQKPSVRPSSWTTKGLDAQMEFPKLYSSKQIQEYMNGNGGMMSSDCEMYTYNNLAEQYIDTCVEKAYAQTMLSSIKDEDTTYLALRQAAMLGIGQSK